MAKRAGFVFDASIRFVPISEEEVMTWRASISLLLQMIKEESLICTFRAHWVGAHQSGA